MSAPTCSVTNFFVLPVCPGHNIFEIFNIPGNFADGTERLTTLGEVPGRMLAFEPACLFLRPSATASAGGGTDGYVWAGYRQSFKYLPSKTPMASISLGENFGAKPGMKSPPMGATIS